MIDDLIGRGTSEPYRMFTSRAEYRLLLRADNADQRLTQLGMDVGCVGDERTRHFTAKMDALKAARELARNLTATPHELQGQGLTINQDGIRRNALDLLSYSHIEWDELTRIWPALAELSPDIATQIEIDGKYSGYLSRQEADIAAFQKDEALMLPEKLDYSQIGSLSAEIRQKLEKNRPATLGAAARIPGMTPAAIAALLRYVKRKAA